MFTATSRIRTLIALVLENPHFDPAGHYVGHAKMILGLLYKTKNKRALALEHLTEAKRILSNSGKPRYLAGRYGSCRTEEIAINRSSSP